MVDFQLPMEPSPALATYRRTAKIRERNIFYFDAGESSDQTPFVMVHGLGDEADTWRHILPILAKTRRVIALDLPGFGRSELPNGKLSIPILINTLDLLIEHLKLSKVILVGHSMGAIICQAYALNHPHRCDALVLVDGSLAAGKTPLDLNLLLYLIPGIGELLYTGLRRNPQAAYNTLRRYYHNLENLPQAERDFLFNRVNQRVWSNKQRAAFFASLRSLAGWLPTQQQGLSERLGAFQPQTTILWGAHDNIMPRANADFLANLLPAHNRQVIIADECGHNLQHEAPEVLLEALLKFPI